MALLMSAPGQRSLTITPSPDLFAPYRALHLLRLERLYAARAKSTEPDGVGCPAG